MATAEVPVQQLALVKCQYCSRSFTSDALDRHQSACMKTTLGNRKQFDSHRQRIEGTELMNYRPHPARSLPGNQRAQPSKANWRQQHTELISALKNARATKRAMDTGLPLPPPPAPSTNPDYVQCPYCLRRFNEKAAERHMPFCKEKMERLPAFKSGNPTPATQRAPMRPPTNIGHPQRPSLASTGTGARPKTSTGEQRSVGSGHVVNEDARSPRRGSLTGTARR